MDKKEEEKKKGNLADNEIRITGRGEVRNYVRYGLTILQNKEHETLTIRATGKATSKAVITAEMLKRIEGNLHQLNNISSLELQETFGQKGKEGGDDI